MTGDAQPGRESLGSCPGCEYDVPASALLVRYESPDGEIVELAGCGRCQVVVHPV